LEDLLFIAFNALRLFFLFLAKRKKSQIQNLQLDDIQAQHVLAFLTQVESVRGDQAETRICRLGGCHSKFCGSFDPARCD
jgi:hypothetical protein